MEFEVKRYQDKAQQQFVLLLNKKVEWIAKDCWPCNLKFHLKELNDIIEAGRKMEVTTASILNEKEIEELVESLTPFRTLDMGAEAHGLLVQMLHEKGVHHEIFAK